MTNEEAISVLNDYDINFERNTAEEVAEAHEMAIKALEEQPSAQPKDECDCISRQAVLEITAETGALETQTRVKALPSVTPQLNTDILDKIRAEIEGIIQKETVVDNSGGEYESIVSKLDPDDVLQIIDKYKAESEE